MKDIIKKKEIKGILGSLLLIVLSVFLMLKPIEIIGTLIKVIGLILLTILLIKKKKAYLIMDLLKEL